MKYAVVDQKGDVYAIRASMVAALAAATKAEEYLDEALSSGHPLARRWVQERLPIEVMELDEFLDDDRDVIRPTMRKRVGLLDRLGVVPVLDREP